MGRSLNPKEQPIFKNMVIAVAGDIGHSEAKIKDWLALRKGTFAADFDDSVTHVLATDEQFKKKGPMIQKAMKNKNVRVLKPDWFDQSMNLNKLQPVSEYSHRKSESNKTSAKTKSQTQTQGKGKGKAKSQTHEEYVDTGSVEVCDFRMIRTDVISTGLFHLYSDSTEFKYAITLSGHDGDRFTVELWESNNHQPHLYHCAGKYYKQGTKKGIPWRISATAGTFQREYECFRSIFLKKTGVRWSERVKAANQEGLVEARVKDSPAYNYQLPEENQPRGKADLLDESASLNSKASGGAGKAAAGASKTKSDNTIAARNKSAPSTPSRAISVDSSDDDTESPSPPPANLPLRPSKNADDDSATGGSFLDHMRVPSMAQKRPSQALGTGAARQSPAPKTSTQKRSSLAPSSNKSTPARTLTPALSQQSVSTPITPKPGRVEGAGSIPQTLPRLPHTPEQSKTIPGWTPVTIPSAPKKPETAKFQSSLKRPRDSTSSTPTGHVQKKLAMMRGPVDENKLLKAKMATEVKAPEHKPEALGIFGNGSGIIDVDAEEETTANTEASAAEAVQTNVDKEKSTTPALSIDLTMDVDDNAAPPVDPAATDKDEVMVTDTANEQTATTTTTTTSTGPCTSPGDVSEDMSEHEGSQNAFQGDHDDKYDALESSLEEDERKDAAEVDDMAVDSDHDSDSTDSN
ncbi:hypothetical protein PFICI_05582 [Pestalotiopsis fici W106-1]|uniref:BRCT domain-containing protein n=1 Tax=Pestalotiopsis fici (strain W106-1 / CGMCC3.15140) TaxID=1229662 RepID=W3XEU1_PESFW|nr:uncharacterized protein PFICI_05582 [Pestalotiopsis fici W106-1]ETS83706.1 hypothetical protein PFICI_05582 [Pestalotiopsis fici W106-1]